jgi:glycosyltransferase involved in cell wall biosynthesis
MKTLSIICINKNSAKFIEQSIRSFLAQDFEDFEILIFDSQSTDNSLEILKKINSNKIKFFNLNPEVNHHDAFIAGIKEAKSEFITFMTSTDGYVDNEWFSKAINCLKKDSQLSFVFANSLRRNIDNCLDKINQPFFSEFVIPEKEDFLPFYLATRYHVNELNCVWTTAVVKKFIENTQTNKDPYLYDLFELLERWIVKNGYLGKHINTLANYGRIHRCSITLKNHSLSARALIKKKQIFFSQAHFEVLENLKDMKFYNRKFEIISNFNNKKIFIFYLNYYFYKLFYPPFKTTKPFYSIYYLFDKLSIFFKDSIIKKLLKIIINIFNKNKFFKTLD